MNKWILKTTFVVGILFVAAQYLLAQNVPVKFNKIATPPQVREKWAVLVGVDKNISELKSTLEDPQFGRFKMDHILLLNDAEANKKNIDDAISHWLESKALPNDLVVVYLASKLDAVDNKGNPYFYAYDSKASDSNSEIDLQNLISGLQQRCKLKYLLCILDIASPGADLHNTGNKSLEALSDNLKAAVWINDDLYELKSNPDARSLFMQYIIEGIKTGAGNLPLFVIAQYVENTVVQESRAKYGKVIRPRFVLARESQDIVNIPFGIIQKSGAQKIAIGHPTDQLALKRPDLIMPHSISGQKTIASTKPAVKVKNLTTVDDDDEDQGSNVDFGTYMAKMKEKIQKAWHPPVSLSSRRLVAVFSILKNGNIVNPSIVEGSGVKELDQSALAALSTASPLDPLPPHSPKSVDIRYSFDWHMVGNATK